MGVGGGIAALGLAAFVNGTLLSGDQTTTRDS
jgi:hypothetical protein